MTDWTDELIARMRMLWDEGHSTAQISLRLGVSKNAVVGKARRCGFPERPSPIGENRVAGKVAEIVKLRTEGLSFEAIGRRVGLGYSTCSEHYARAVGGRLAVRIVPLVRSLPPLPSIQKAAPMPLQRLQFASPGRRPALPAPARAVASADLPPPSHAACQWPTNDGAGLRWTFCGSGAMEPGKPYCTAHCGRAYQGFVSRRVEVAANAP